MKSNLKLIIGIILAAIVVYNSVYFMPLDEKMASETEVEFDAEAYVDDIWGASLLPTFNEAAEITKLTKLLKENSKTAFETEANALGIGNIGYFKVQGSGTVVQVNENDLILKIGDELFELEMEFVFGNAVRDASRLIRINDYDQTSDINNISQAINAKIRKEVIPTFRSTIKKGDAIAFNGAMELNQAHLDLDQPEIIPVSVKIGS